MAEDAEEHHEDTPVFVGEPSRTRFLGTAIRIAGVALILVVLVRPDQYFTASVKHLQFFARQKADFQALRMCLPEMRTAFEAKRYIPADSPYDCSRPTDLWTWDYVRYIMYPNTRLNKDWDFFIDMKGEIKTPEPGWKSVLLSSGVMLYARNGKSFLDPPLPPAPSYGNRWNVLVFAMITLAQVALGLALLFLFGVPVRDCGTLWFASCAYLVGFWTANAIPWTFLLVGIPFRPWPLVAGYVIVLVLTAGAALRFRGKAPGTAVNSTRGSLWPDSPVGWLLAVAVVALATAMLLPDTLSPMFSFDTLAHWVYKAKALVHHGSLDFLKEVNHQEYPLTWSLNAAVLFLFAGGSYDEMVAWTNLLMFAALLVQLMGAGAFLKTGAGWCWGLALAFLVFFYHDIFGWSYADTPLAAYLAGLSGTMILWASRDYAPRYLALALSMAFGLALTKLEGGPAVLFAAGALAVAYEGFPFSRKGWLIVGVFLVPVLVAMSWSFYTRQLGYAGDSHLKEGLSWFRIHLLLTRVLDSATGAGDGWWLFAGTTLVLFLKPRRPWRPQEIFLGILGLLLILFTPAALAGWPTKDLDTQTLTATPRLILHATPVLLLLFGSLLCGEKDPATSEQGK